MSDKFDLDWVINHLSNAKLLPEPILCTLILKFMEKLYNESNILELSSPIICVGDVHGQLYDLFEMLKKTAPGGITNQKYLFLGDVVDRGRYSVATFAYIAALVLKYPNQVFMIRGNHESRQVNQTYGFYHECMSLYGHSGVWNLLNQAFDTLPVGALVDNKYFCVHGGLSPHIPLIESFALMSRFQEIPQRGPLCDIAWSDPDEKDQWHENSRGSGWLFGPSQTEAFMRNNDLKMIIRSHQLCPEGYMWHFGNKVCTLWSAPNYMYRFGNKASVLVVDGEETKIEMFDACPDEDRKVPEEYKQSSYFI